MTQFLQSVTAPKFVFATYYTTASIYTPFADT